MGSAVRGAPSATDSTPAKRPPAVGEGCRDRDDRRGGGSAPAAVGGGDAGGAAGSGTRTGSSRGARRGVVGAAFAVGVAWATNGEPPSPAEVVVSAVPILNVASAKDHGETVIPIIVMLLGWKATVVTGAAYGVYKYGEAVQEEPILAIPPAAAGLGAPAHTLGAKGGYGNLLCYPGKPGCGSRRR